MKTLIKNGLVVSPNGETLQDILIVDGLIADIGNITSDCDYVCDAAGNYILPGLIDMNCNICEPGYEYKEDIASASNAAARGGFTSITCNPNTNPVIDSKTVVQYIISKSKDSSKVNILPYGSMTKGCKGIEIAEIGEMRQFGIVAVSDGEKTISDNNLLRNIFKYSKMFDIPVITHCEDKVLAGDGVINEGYISTRLGLSPCPREAEEVIVSRNLVLASHINNKLHISNITTKGSVELIKEAKKRGVKVTSATSPHYFSLTEEVVDSYDALTKVTPPLRTASDVSAIISGLIDGDIDIIASSHTPTTLEEKKTEFSSAAVGISSLETAFAVSYTHLVLPGKLSLLSLIKKMSENPAEILGLLNKGKLKIGFDADLIIVDVNNKYKINSSKFHSKAKHSPYNGQEVYGRILKTFVGGIEV